MLKVAIGRKTTTGLYVKYIKAVECEGGCLYVEKQNPETTNVTGRIETRFFSIFDVFCD